MPNWCENTLEIRGDRAKIKALWEQAQKNEEQGGSLLRALRPEPDYDKVTVEPAFPDPEGKLSPMPDWWDWRVDNWGSKWEIDPEGLLYEENDDGSALIYGYFESAWSPPLEALQYYAEQNPDVELSLKYFEAGMGFIGQWDSEGVEYYCDDVSEHLKIELDDNPTLYELMDEFWVWSHYELEEENENEN